MTVNSPKPLVSIIIPVYNCEKYLEEAINSALVQSYPRMEIIVVDDGSTDRTAKVAQKYGAQLQYIYQSNQGAGSAKNTGIERSNGEYLAFLDADDIWEKNKIELQMATLESNADLDIVFGHVRNFYTPGLSESIRKSVHCPPHPMPGHIPSCALVRRASFFKVGFFNIDLPIAAFADWYARVVEQKLVMMTLPDVLTHRRIHDNNMGIRLRHHSSVRLHILKASLDRRKQLAP
ncbi:MAG: glycosyltransferase [Phormidesmis sp.]